MADWQRTLDLNPEWSDCVADLITNAACALSIAYKLRALERFEPGPVEVRRLSLADLFESLAKIDDPTSARFNGCMAVLYDWADERQTCWVVTEAEEAMRVAA